MILLDTHIWLNWLILGEESLPPGIRNAITTADRIPNMDIYLNQIDKHVDLQAVA